MKLGIGIGLPGGSRRPTVAEIIAELPTPTDATVRTWDASQLATLFSDTAGTTPAVVDGPVRRINDASGNGDYLTNATGWILRESGGIHWLDMDGTTHFTRAGVITSDVATVSEYEWLIAARVMTPATDGTTVWQNAGIFGDTSGYVGTVFRSSGTVRGFNLAGTYQNAAAAYAFGTDAVFNQRHVGDVLSLRVDDGAFSSTASGNTALVDRQLNLGKAVSSQPLVTGRFYAIYTRRTVLTDEERARGLAYMQGIMP